MRADQQDPDRHLPRPRALRVHLRPRAPDGHRGRGELGMDPAELRRRNFITAGRVALRGRRRLAQPAHRLRLRRLPVRVRPGAGGLGLRAARAEQAEARRQGRYVGIGVGCLVEKSGLGPWEYARVEVDGTGHVVVYSGVAAVGQGIETTLAQVVRRRARSRRRRRSPWSMATARGCRSAWAASPAAAPRWRCPPRGGRPQGPREDRPRGRRAPGGGPDDLVLDGGAVHVRGLPDRRVTFRDLARAAVPGRRAWSRGSTPPHFFEAPK